MKKESLTKIGKALLLLAVIAITHVAPLGAQVVNVGSGSYTTTFPGVDAAGRNGYPSGTPLPQVLRLPNQRLPTIGGATR